MLLTADTSAVAKMLDSFMDSINLTSIVWAVALFLLCSLCTRLLMKLAGKLMNRSKLDKSLHSIILSTLKILLIFLTVLIVAPSLGIDTASLLAVLSIVGVAVSLSIQGILGNFFSGITLLMSKPFKVGDYVTIGGSSGTVVETGITHTKLHTPDNQTILVPNSSVTSNTITNVSTATTRRVDLTISASYNAAPEAVIDALTEAASIPQVLQDPPVLVRLNKYGESSMEYTVRVWVNSEDYWDAYFDITARVKPAFDARGIEMTYPHINVHTV